MSNESTKELLQRVSLFSGLDDAALDGILGLTFQRTFEPGEAIVEEGHTGNGLYVILSGRVEVVKSEASDRPQLLATLGEGEPFGELALLGEWKRTATVRAVEQTTCLGMDRWVFLAHLQRQPAMAVTLLQVLTQRLVDTDTRIASG